MAKGLRFVKKNKHILVENGAAFLGLMIVLVVMVMSFVYFLVCVQIMNDEGVFMYSDQHNINKQLSDVSVLPQLEEIWKAGHMNPVVLRSGGSYEMIRNSHSMVVGIMEDMEYEETVWKLGPGDRIFIYSDGVTEAENSQSEQFGNDKLVDVLNEVSDRSQKEVLEHVGRAVSDFAAGADQSDDITMLGFTYYGAAKE